MKGEEQILELWAEVLRKQDQTQETLRQLAARLSNREENQLAHQQLLRTLVLNQQKHQREPEDIVGILNSVTRM